MICPPNGWQHEQPYFTHTNHHWYQQHHLTHKFTSPNTQHIWMHKPWGTHPLLPQVSTLPPKTHGWQPSTLAASEGGLDEQPLLLTTTLKQSKQQSKGISTNVGKDCALPKKSSINFPYANTHQWIHPLSTLPLKNNQENYSALKLDNFSTLPIGDIHTFLSSTYTMQMQSLLKPSKIAVIHKSFQPTQNGTHFLPQEVSNHDLTKSTLEHP